MAGAYPRAVIFGVAGPTLTKKERHFFTDVDPLGFILFARNCLDPAGTLALVADLRESVGRSDALVLIDQEGGRVQRLKPPFWRAAPPAQAFGRLAEVDEANAVEAVWLNSRLLAADLIALGIDVDCAPVLDVRQPEGHDVIGDRAFANQPETVALLGRASCAGFLAGGVLPVIKHIPGHGRATLDSHEALPVVNTPLEDLRRVDFAPFAALANMPMAMTAHVIYDVIDPVAPATTSAKVIREAIRSAIGFEGLLISDDLCMRALSGRAGDRASAAIAAGCDVTLHCNGDFGEMREIAAVCPTLSPETVRRLARAQSMRAKAEPFDRERAQQRLAALLGAQVGA